MDTANQTSHALGSAERDLDTYIADAVQAWGIPGAAVALVKDDTVVLARGYGHRALDSDALVTEQTLFEIASITKSFTATAVAMLVDEGRVHWDDPLVRFLPNLQLPDPAMTHAITLRDVLTHRSGLIAGLLSNLGCSRADVLGRLRHLAPAHFREQLVYQNVNYVLAGEVVAAVTGQSWEQFIQERLFTPLGMRDSLTSHRTMQYDANHAMPHVRSDGVLHSIPLSDLDADGPAASILSSAIDMAQWLRLHLNRGMHNQEQLLSPGVLRELHMLQIVEPVDGPAQGFFYPLTHEPQYAGYGFGWGVRDYRGRRFVAHPGASDGMWSLAALVPEERVGVVILTNADASERQLFWLSALVFRALDPYLSAPPRDWGAEYLSLARERQATTVAAALEPTQIAGTVPSLTLSAYAGTYDSGYYGTAQVEHAAGQLTLHISSALTGPLSHWHYDTFRATWANPTRPQARVTFTLDRDGEVDTMTVHDLEPPLPVFKRRGVSPAAPV